MLLLGLDIGTSSIKASVIDADKQQVVVSASFPEKEAKIHVPQTGWAEQNPEKWWEYVQKAILKCHATKKYNPKDITAIGIAYQMHGLVLVDENQKVLRNAIIWCDSRAIEIGDNAFDDIGKAYCLSHFLNSPGNFTASKLAWVKANEPEIYKRIDKIMLPGDFIAMKMTGSITTSPSALSEGIFWDFQKDELSEDILNYFGFENSFFPDVQPVFSIHGKLKDSVAEKLSLSTDISLAYKAGDQPNNALTLNVMQPGEVAATAGTSGVIYGINDRLKYDEESRVNSFAHVNYSGEMKRIGVLLCINGTAIFYRWIRDIIGTDFSYPEMNELASSVDQGADGLFALPFGNGAERMLNNKTVGAHFLNLDFNVHSKGHLLKAILEGIAFSFRYGLDIMRENGINPSVIRVSKANLFLSDVFAQIFADINNVTVEFYDGDGSYGAAIGAGIGAGVFRSIEDAAMNRQPVGYLHPQNNQRYEKVYNEWKENLKKFL